MDRDEQFDLWESELSFRERAEMALDFIESHSTAFGTIISVDFKSDTASIYYDLQAAFTEYLRNLYEELESAYEDSYDQDELWVNHDVDDPRYQ